MPMKQAELTPDQLKRLRVALVHHSMQKSLTAARKATSSMAKCRVAAVELFQSFGIPKSLDDVADLYVVDEPEASKNKRGKGKSPSKKLYPVRLDPAMLEELRSLDGSVSGHIRSAIQQYLDK